MKSVATVLFILSLACPALAEMWVSPDCPGAALCVNNLCYNAHHMAGTPGQPLLPCTKPATSQAKSVASPAPMNGRIPGFGANTFGPAISNPAGRSIGFGTGVR